MIEWERMSVDPSTLAAVRLVEPHMSTTMDASPLEHGWLLQVLLKGANDWVTLYSTAGTDASERNQIELDYQRLNGAMRVERRRTRSTARSRGNL